MPVTKLPNGDYEVAKDDNERNQRIIDRTMDVISTLYIPEVEEKVDG